jgi:RecA-family ATPase
MPIEDLNFPSLKIKMTTSTKPVRQPKLTAWQQQNPYPGVIGREPEFIVKPANKWLREGRRKRDPKMLFDHFWYENELCILFADSNTGKSVLAVQIGDSISRGQPIGGMQMTAAPGGVLYFDYELSDKQFQLRYSNGDTENYRFHKRFSRATANPQANKMYKFNGYQDYIENELENALLTAKAKVLIIDNISCLSYHTNVSTGAATLMNTMRKIIIKYQISILLLAHTPKRNPVSLITQHDLQGSKMLINFCDSAFAIGESRQTPGMRYLKQIKQRSTQQTYGADNVCLCTIKKQDNFLQFQFTAHANEADHLQQKNTMERELVKAKVMELSREGMSIRKIAGELGLSASAVNRMTKQPNS